MRRPINTVNGTYKDPNLAFSAQDALNVIPMMTEKSGTRTVSQYRQAPGLKPFCRIGTNDGETVTYAGAGRGLRVVDGKLYAVAGRNLWQITSAGVSVNYGTIPGVGRVSMAHNQRGLGNELAIDNGQSRYVFNTQTQDLQKVTDESFPGSIKAVFIDGYIVFVEPQGRYWGHSDLSNALNYNIFDQYEAEGQPDRIVSAHESNRELLIFGQDTTEAYVNNPSGSGEAPFVRATNTVIKSGCAARDSVCDVGPYTVYLDQNRTVQVLNGYTPVPISTSVIDSALQACTKQQIANAYAFAVESEGFQIYYLTVPGKFTFGYDFKNREWHRRSSTGLDWWAVTDVVQWNGSWYALDSRRGDILELRWYDYPFDVQEELVREWVTGTISADQNPIFVNELEVLFGCGGKAYTTVDFPEQPVGPSITGSPPGGSVGVAYGPYTFTVTPGDAPIARTIILAGSIPAGLTWNRNTATLSGTPTDTGLYSFTLRTFDTNGLFADLEVSIPVATVMMVLKQTASVANDEYMLSDGYDWTGSFTAKALLDSKPFLIGTRSSFVAYGASVAHPVRTTDFGATWVEATGTQQSGVGGSRRGWYSPVADAIMLPQGAGNPCTLSVDDGESFASVTLGNSNGVTALELNGITRWVSLRGPEQQITTSDDLGATATDTTVIPDSSFSAAVTLFSDGPRCYVGGRNAANTSPRIWMTEDGTNFDLETLPTLSGTAIVRIDGGLVDDVIRVVAWTELGELIIRQDDGSWTIATDQPDGIPSDAAGNGAVLAINVNKDDPADNKGIVYLVGPDGSLDERRRDTLPDTDAFTGLAALVAP
jgi:hypothetical protein